MSADIHMMGDWGFHRLRGRPRHIWRGTDGMWRVDEEEQVYGSIHEVFAAYGEPINDNEE